MVITYFGHQFFKVQFGDTIIAYNPISKDSKLQTSKFGADIALISLKDKDFNGAEQVSFGERKAFVIDGPGEYETGRVYIKGFASQGMNKKINTIYTVSLEGMNICFLGALLSKEIKGETKEAFGDIDILFVPIGGGDVLTASEGYKIAVSLGAKLIIPMQYDEASLKDFLKEGGEKVEPADKLTLKKKDLEGKEGDIITHTPQA